jgi:hypothetical protein
MNACNAPKQCDSRAVRLARVKFVALPMELEADTAAPSESGAHILRTVLANLIRVIGRLEAARP